MEFIDLRSDTVTRPTPEMRKAMAQAEVGDDVYGEDPTVNQLQEMAAEITGHQAALFVPSGTMGNLASILAHCQRGDEIIVGDKAHNFLYEAGGIAALGGIQPHPIPNQPDGALALDDIEAAIRADDAHFPPTKLIALENTHNRCGGAALPAAYMQSVAALAKDRGLKLHLDGARIFNAAVELGVTAKALTEMTDSVTFCLSKALSAPVGSLICGSSEFIARAHRVRKQLGGGMRQAGVLAAAGVVALEQMVERLSEDHARARRLAEMLSSVKGIDLESQHTNMVYLALAGNVKLSAQEVARRLKEKGVGVGVVGERRFRLVTHVWVDNAAVEAAARRFAEELAVA